MNEKQMSLTQNLSDHCNNVVHHKYGLVKRETHLFLILYKSYYEQWENTW